MEFLRMKRVPKAVGVRKANRNLFLITPLV